MQQLLLAPPRGLISVIAMHTLTLSLSVQTPCLVIRSRHAMCGQQADCEDPGVEISEQWAAVARQTRARTHVCVVSSVKSY